MENPFKKMKNKLFYFFVEKNPYILRDYQTYRWENEDIHSKFRALSWMYLIYLNFQYRVLKKEPPTVGSTGNKGNNLKKTSKKKVTSLPYLTGPESNIEQRPPIQHFVKKLIADYDIISFDIFDTLILRPFSDPKDVFLLLAYKHDYLDFADIRDKEEKILREINFAKNGTREVTLDEIYERISKYTGIDKESGMQIEFETELELCFANPYMKEVFEILKYNGKKLIAVSDMYFPKSMIVQLLRKCGYEGFEEIFVSCDHGCSKRDMGLYKIVDETITNGKKVMHIGDNHTTDILRAREFGWDATFYKNVHSIGQQFRPHEMSPLIGSAYSGIVNTHLHNGIEKFNPYYEFGFLYGGLFVIGYCNFIHEYTKKNNITKILFLSRDGEIIKKVYDKLFPDDNTEYVYWSRIAATRLNCSSQRYDYIYQYITLKSRNNKKFTAKQLLESMEIEFLIDKLQEIGLYPHTLIDEDISSVMEMFIINNWNEIIDSYKDEVNAAKSYLDPIIKDHKKICVVDIGWRGSGAMALRNLIQRTWEYEIEIIGLLGASSKYEINSNIPQIMSGTLESYMFSQIHNLDKFNFQRRNKRNNMIIELLVSAKHPSFKTFKKVENDDYEIIFDVPEIENYEIIEEIQRGILDFSDSYSSHFEKYAFMLRIPGNDAYASIMHILKDLTFIKKYFGKYVYNRYVSNDSKYSSFETMSDILE